MTRLLAALALLAAPASALDLTIAPESRCSPYDKSRDYAYPQSIEPRIVERMGGVIYSPYDDKVYDSISQTDIEHIVATSEAHDSGLCARPAEDRKAFANDLENLTLAPPSINRHDKSGKDAGEWLPDNNRCWFAQVVIGVKRKWGLSVDQREHDALARVMAGC